MRPPVVRKAIHARLHPRQAVAPVDPAVMPQAAHDTSSVHLSTGPAVITAGITPTATALVIDTAFGSITSPPPTPLPSSKPVSVQTSTSGQVLSSTITPDVPLPTIAIDPFQQVYNGMTLAALHSLPPWVMMGAVGGAALLVLITAYCFICRWYYKRLPRSIARWDIDDRAKKELVYGDQPRFSSSEEKPTPVDDDRSGVAVGDSYFPQGETWRKFEGRTARHPESFIYTGQDLEELDSYSAASSPVSSGAPNLPAGLARPRPRFAHSQRRGQIDSVFSTVSFPTTHRADSIRESNFFPDGFEHDGEVWDLASPGFVTGESRPSMDSTARSVNITRASIFGVASASARGSVVVYDSYTTPTRSILDDDPFARSGEGNGSAYVYPTEKYSGKKSFDGGKRSMDGHHTRTKSRDVRALGTLVEDMDEDGKVPPLPRLPSHCTLGSRLTLVPSVLAELHNGRSELALAGAPLTYPIVGLLPLRACVIEASADVSTATGALALIALRIRLHQLPPHPLEMNNPPAASPLAPPKDDPFTLERLKEFDGSDPSKPLYLSIKGTVFDVSPKRDTYGPGGSYALLAGKDASVGKSSLKPEDAIPDYSTLEASEKQTLEQWHGFFSKVGGSYQQARAQI
ncbi:hypothetical protein FRC10_004476 [Ceratobasidium sp. 414]|nr:hypothetical protein FRC10_004476 [Ceratobasidium sp. 414]